MGRTKIDELDLARAIERMDADESPNIGYSTWALAQLTLPYQRPKPGITVWERRNGRLRLTVTPGQELDATGTYQPAWPYGTMPRLLLAWMCREAVLTRSPTLELGNSLTGFMREVGITPSSGKNGSRGRVQQHLKALLTATMEIHYDDGPNHDMGGGFRVGRSWNLFWDNDNHGTGNLLGGSMITLATDFFNEIIQHPVPVNIAALKILQGSAPRLDYYTWLTSRLYRLETPVTVPWRSLMQQFGSSGNPDNSKDLYDFKRDFKAHLVKVLAVYHEARVEPTETGLKLMPSPPHVPVRGTHAIRRAQRAATAPKRRPLPSLSEQLALPAVPADGGRTSVTAEAGGRLFD